MRQRPNLSESPTASHDMLRVPQDGGNSSLEINQPQQPKGHTMQRRTAAQSYCLPSRSPRGSSRDTRKYRDSHEKTRDNFSMEGNFQHRSDRGTSAVVEAELMNSSSSNVSISVGAHNDSMDENGRCLRHPTIELRRRETSGNNKSSWRVLLQDCPLCSLDIGTSAKSKHSNKQNKKEVETATTVATSSSSGDEKEDVETKSWTMSDASSAEEDNCNGKVQPSIVQQKMKPPAPPPPRPPSTTAYSERSSRSSNAYAVQSLKDLGRRLTMESETLASSAIPSEETSMGASASSAMFLKNPPPPPSTGRKSYIDNNTSPYSSNDPSEIRRRLKSSKAATLARSLGQQEEVLGKASDLISRMSRITSESSASEMRSRDKQRYTRTKKQAQVEEETAHTHGISSETNSVLGAAVDVHSLLQQRSIENKSTRGVFASVNDSHGKSRMVYDDSGGSARGAISHDNHGRGMVRGRVRVDDDILSTAAEIRSRAQRSLSRSRERLKTTSIFCGETPRGNEDDNDEDYNEDESIVTFQSKRSILNPHGLAQQPQASIVERRSVSRERSRIGRDDANEEQIEQLKRERRPVGRFHQPDEEHLEINDGNENMTAAQVLISRRREMRQKIAERQNIAEKRHNRFDITPPEGPGFHSAPDLMDKPLADFASTSNIGRTWSQSVHREEERRGRSRSVVRDGLSKIRSASLQAFRKQSSLSQNMKDSESIDTDKKSTASSILERLSKRSNIRSLSRSRSIAADTIDSETDYKSDRFLGMKHRTHVVNDDENSSRSSILGRFSRIKNMGKIRSISQGRSRINSEDFDLYETKSDIFSGNTNSAWAGRDDDRLTLKSVSRHYSDDDSQGKGLSFNGGSRRGILEGRDTRSYRTSDVHKTDFLRSNLQQKSPTFENGMRSNGSRQSEYVHTRAAWDD